MLMLPLGGFFYLLISPSSYVYRVIFGKLHFIIRPLAEALETAPLIPIAVIIIIIESFYLSYLWRHKHDLAFNLTPRPSPA